MSTNQKKRFVPVRKFWLGSATVPYKVQGWNPRQLNSSRVFPALGFWMPTSSECLPVLVAVSKIYRKYIAHLLSSLGGSRHFLQLAGVFSSSQPIASRLTPLAINTARSSGPADKHTPWPCGYAHALALQIRISLSPPDTPWPAGYALALLIRISLNPPDTPWPAGYALALRIRIGPSPPDIHTPWPCKYANTRICIRQRR